MKARLPRSNLPNMKDPDERYRRCSIMHSFLPFTKTECTEFTYSVWAHLLVAKFFFMKTLKSEMTSG